MLFEQRVRVERLLHRFFSKFFLEALHLNADEGLFEVQDNELAVILRKKGSTLKETVLNARWADTLKHWLDERDVSWWCRALVDDADKGKAFRALLRQEDFVFAAFDDLHVGSEGNGTSLARCSSFQSISKKMAFSKLMPGEFAGMVLDKLTKLDTDIVVAAAPSKSDSHKAAAFLLTITGAASIGDLNTCTISETSLENNLRDGAFVGSLIASDPVEAFLYCSDYLRQQIAAVVCMSFLPRLCSYCAVEDNDALDVLRKLGADLSSQEAGWCKRGPGCSKCSGKGIRGEIPVQSILIVGDAVRSLINSHKSDEELRQKIHERGIRPLLSDGLKKAAAGAISLQDLVDGVAGPQEDWAQAERLSVDFDKTAGAESSWLTGSDKASVAAATTDGEVDSPDADRPLFHVGKAGVVREKPLIMVVEDDSDQQQILELVLGSAGYDVTCAGNGKEALWGVDKESPDLILTDIMMPEMDGLQMLAQLKSDSRFRSIPVLVLTVLSDVDKEFEMLDAGADDYCEKSVQRKILLKRIENLLKRSAHE